MIVKSVVARHRAWVALSAGLLVSFLALASTAPSALATSLPSTIDTDQTWTASNSPYTGGSVTVESGVTVTVEPGAVIKLSGALTVNGTLDADGTSSSPITFTSPQDSASPSWSGIELNSSASVLDHAWVRYSAGGAVTVSGGSSPTISNSTLKNSGYGVSVNGGGSPEIFGNEITDHVNEGISYSGGGAPAGSQVKVHDNEIRRSGSHSGGAIVVASPGVNVEGVTLVDNTIADNEGMAIYYNGSNDSILPPDISDNAITGNEQNGIFLSGKLASNATWGGGPFVINGFQGLTIASGKTLAVEPGTVFKSAPWASWGGEGTLVANGTLDAQGTTANPVVFTSLQDDSAGGDTNGDGGSSGGEWGGIELHSDGSILNHTELRNARYGAVMVNEGSSPTIANSTLSNSGTGVSVNHAGAPEIYGNEIFDNAGHGIYYSGGAPGEIRIHDNLVRDNTGAGIGISSPDTSVEGITLAGNTVIDNAGKAIYYWGSDDSILPPDISDNAISGNDQDGIFLAGKIGSDASWGGGPIVIDSKLTVPAGVTLTLEPGTVIKGNGANWSGTLVANGTLDAQGTATDPVVFTSLQDDSAGGDTNGDGGSSGGEWGGIELHSDGSILNHTELRNARYGAVMVNEGSSPTIANSTLKNSGSGVNVQSGGSPDIHDNKITDVSSHGVYYSGGGAPAGGQVNIHDNEIRRSGGGGIWVIAPEANVTGVTLAGNTIADNAGKAIYYGGSNDSILPPDISDNTIVGNEQNGIFLSGKIGSDSTWGGGPIVMNGGSELRVPLGITLTIEPGTVVKAGSGSKLAVTGSLEASGTEAAPITFTSLWNDRVGGDTNGDGASSSPGDSDWNGIDFYDDTWGMSGTGTLERVTITHSLRGVGIFCPCSTPPTISYSTVAFTGSAGITIGSDVGSTATGEPVVSHMTFRRNGSYAINKAGGPIMQSPWNDYGCSNGPQPIGCGEPINEFVDPHPYAPTVAQDGPCQGAETQCGEGADPVIMATGAFTYAHNDLRLSGLDRPLVFARTYNSSDPSDTGLGVGWSSAGLIRAADLGNGDVMVAWDDGKQETYELQTDGSYTSPAGSYTVLTKQSDGYTLVRESGATTRRTFVFDETGRVASITDAQGHQTTYDYNSVGRLISITDPTNQKLLFSYNASNHISSVTDSTNRTVSFGYTDGRLTSATDPMNKTTTYGYDSVGRLDSITDPRGNEFVRNDYDSQDRVVTQTDGEGNVWTIDYVPDQTTIHPPEGGTQVQEFDEQNRLIAKTDEVGSRTAFSYDAEGNISGIVRPGGASWTLDYTNRKLATITGPGGVEESYTYNSLRLPSSFTDPRGETWAYEYSPERELTEVTDPLGNETSFDYHPSGRLESVTDANANTKTFGYDALGNLTSVEDGLGHITTFAYNARSELTAVEEPGKDPATIARDAMGRVTATETAEGHETTYDYNANGALIKTTDPGNHEWSVERNAMDLPIAYDDPLGKRTEIAYDDNLRVSSVTDRRGKVTSYGYDLANHLTSISQPDGADWGFAYNSRGKLSAAEDPLGNETTYGYDLLDRLTRVSQPLGVETLYDYNGAGDLLELTDPDGYETDFDYDDLGRLVAKSEPLGKTTSYTYDGVGNLLEEQDPVNALQYTYDDADRLTLVKEGPTTLRDLAYDPADRLIEATDPQGDAIELTYDDDDQITAIDDGRGMEATLDYNARGLLSSETDERGTIGYAYDELGRLEHLTDPSSQQTDYAYDDEGNLKTIELPNGIETTNSFDPLGRLDKTTSRLGTTKVQEFIYGFDLVGNRVSEIDRNDDETTYDYDALNRLVEFDPPAAPAVSYGYDDRGNRTSAGGVTFGYDALSRLTSSTDGRTYDYDSAGRLTEIASSALVTNYSFDALDQLATVERTDPTATTTYPQIDLDYDALGRQAKRSSGSSVRKSHYSGLGSAPGFEASGTGSLTRKFFYGASGLTKVTGGSGTSFPLADKRGDLTASTDGSGAVTSRQSFDPFGTRISGGASEQGFAYASGARTDPDTGLVGTGATPYSPETASYPTPGASATGASPYAAGTNPLTPAGEGALSPTALFSTLASLQDVLNALPTNPGLGASYAAGIGTLSPQAKVSACSASRDRDLLDDAGQAFMSFMDSTTLGTTAEVRDLAGLSDAVDPCNPWSERGAFLGDYNPWGFVKKAGVDAVKKGIKIIDDVVDEGSSVARVADDAAGVTKTTKTRVEPGSDGGVSEHVIEAQKGQTISVTHRVTRDEDVVHQHQTHVGKHGGQRRFPDEWIEYPTIP